MNQGHRSQKRAACVVIAIVFTLLLSRLSSSGPQTAQNRQSSSTPTQDEVAALAERFIESLRDAGNVRNVAPELMHPLLLEGPPCSVVPSVEADVCHALSSEDRRDYVLAEINFMWLMYEYQLSLSVPVWLRGDRSQVDPFDVFPTEVRQLIKKLVGTTKTVEAFKEAYTIIKEVETRMLERHSRMTEADKLNIVQNGKMISEAFRRDSPGDVVPFREVSEEAFGYTKPPFFLIVAKDRGVLKLIWFSFATQ